MRNIMDNFDYPYTCPTIDSKISDTKSCIEGELRDFLSAFVDMDSLDHNYLEDKLDWYKDTIYDSSFGDQFEDVRECNSDMWKAAEQRITDLIERIEQLDDEISGTEDENDDLRERISELERQIDIHDSKF